MGLSRPAIARTEARKPPPLLSTREAEKTGVRTRVNDIITYDLGGAATHNTGVLTAASFWTPVHVMESAWLEHGPFAFWLIEAIRPRTVVELGTHRGFSYLAFCQAVQTLGLDTACYAIDTWKGDDHAGFYDDSVWRELSTINDRHYRGFSTLIRSLFSDALPYFGDGTVDLLHIDGRHGYEDARADFESWVPKLSDRAVVLFHDTNVRERGFGVWRLWQDLAREHPSFEFIHGHGLGVLAVGPAVPGGLSPLLRATAAETAATRSAYARLGRAVSTQLEQSRASQQNTGLTAAITEAQRYTRDLESQIAAKTAALDEAARQGDLAHQQNAHLTAAMAEVTQYARGLEDQIAAKTAALDEAAAARDVSEVLAASVADLRAERRIRMQQIVDLHGRAALVPGLERTRDSLRAELDAILNSAFWRRTSPLRRRLAAYPRSRRFAVRGAKLLWWTMTLQLPRRLRARRQPPPAPVPDDKALFTAAARAELARFLASTERLTFPEAPTPDISVAIVLWNQAHLTLRCLRALHAAGGPSREIIVFDNGSSDETMALLARVDGIRVIRSEANIGFLLGCNRGAEIATGRALLLLNSDAFVRAETLDHALTTLESAEDIGAVVARLLLPSGCLQEAGSIVWSDASCLGYARGAAAEAFEAMFRRDVDYGSGAFLLTRRALWTRLGGFDEAFAPAYYEETDYCMRLQAAGYRVVYDPEAVVDHFEFGSEGKSGDGVDAMVRNQARFKARHGAVLERRHLPPVPENILAARTAASRPRPRLLVLDNEVPLAAGGAGYPRAQEMLDAATQAGWAVTLFPLHALAVDWDAARGEIAPEVEIVSGHAAGRLAEFMGVRRGYYDTVMISRPENMMLVRGILREHPDLFAGARVIYDSEALAATREIAKAAVEGRPLAAAEAAALIAEELVLANGADAIICVNEAEAGMFRSRGVPVHVLSHSVTCLDAPPPWEDRAGFLFIGRLLERDAPNWQGLVWFIAEVWPRIRQAVPQATLTVVGRLHPEHAELVAPGVRLVGAVADLRPVYDAARVFVAPVRFAAGVPRKIHDAAAAGVPVAGTALMARQLDWVPGTEIAAADTPQAFAAAAAALHEDAAAWTAMSAAALKRVREEHSPAAFAARVKQVLDPAPSAFLGSTVIPSAAARPD
jgi:GT2 family glycosyltransferase